MDNSRLSCAICALALVFSVSSYAAAVRSDDSGAVAKDNPGLELDGTIYNASNSANSFPQAPGLATLIGIGLLGLAGISRWKSR